MTAIEIAEKIKEIEPLRKFILSSLRQSTNQPGIVSFSRTSTYGLKLWEEDGNVKGGTIKDMVLEYLTNSNEPVHILELEQYVLKFRPETNRINILSNMRIKNQMFLFFPQGFVGLISKRESSYYNAYITLPIHFVAHLKSDLHRNNNKLTDIIKKYLPIFNITEAKFLQVIDYHIAENHIKINDGYILKGDNDE